ncbi:unnamed protein product [Alopecurus aequalis]
MKDAHTDWCRRTSPYKYLAASSSFLQANTRDTITYTQHKIGRQGARRRSEAMEYEYQYSSSSFAKEKRPPVKRGQVKLQIARALSNLVSLTPSTAAAADGSKQAARNSFRRETSYN